MKPLLIIGIALYWCIIALMFSGALGSPLATQGYTGTHDVADITGFNTQYNSPAYLINGAVCQNDTQCYSGNCDTAWFGDDTCKPSVGINGVGEFFSSVGDFFSSIFRLFGLLLFGIGLPVGTPLWFQIPFSMLSFMIFIIFVVGLF
jgi:hypothetical protein